MPLSALPDFEIYSVDPDSVVDAIVATGRTHYQFAVERLAPLIDTLDIQRKIQNPRFYERLQRDVLHGCIMPAITLAFVDKKHGKLDTTKKFLAYLTANIDHAFVLDGIQRLNTLKRASTDPDFPPNQPLFINALVCKSADNLLYRMITLNNGQKPMTTRHQIEVLTANLFGEEDDSTITLTTEKESIRRARGIFSKADFALGYVAFLSESTTVDSQKLIQEKLDELLANKILENRPEVNAVEFRDVRLLIGKLAENPDVDRWLKLSNNLIGFCASARKSYTDLATISPEKFGLFIQEFEEAFRSFDVAKLKVGRVRRESVAYVIKNIHRLRNQRAEQLMEKLVSVVE